MRAPSQITRVADELGAEAVTLRVLAKRATPHVAGDLAEMAKRLDMLSGALRAETGRGKTKGAAA